MTTNFFRKAFVIALMLWSMSASCVEIVRYPIRETSGDRRYDYPRKLLELALSKTQTKYQVVYPSIPMNQERQVRELEAGRTIDVGPIPTSVEREARLLPIRIPLNKGLLGWRLGLIRKGDEALLSHVTTLADLKRIRLGQGREWPDTQILEGNGINVIIGNTYGGLFMMLASKRFDYFPRSVMEIWGELDENKDTLQIEQRLALHYFYDSYFFVNKRNTKLANDIREGLEKAIADGSFNQLFEEYWGEAIRKARLNERIVIEIFNPLLSPETPSNRPELWYGQVQQRSVTTSRVKGASFD